MSRSLYMRLHRRFGQRDTGTTKVRRTEARLAALARYQASFRSTDLSGTTVVVVGAGFAGLSAAYQLAQMGATVTVLEAQSGVGGRVLSNPNFIPGLTIE